MLCRSFWLIVASLALSACDAAPPDVGDPPGTLASAEAPAVDVSAAVPAELKPDTGRRRVESLRLPGLPRPPDAALGRALAEELRAAGRSRSALQRIAKRIDGDPSSAIEALRWLLANGEDDARRFAAVRLTAMKSLPAACFPEIRAATNDSDADVRNAVPVLLAKIDTDDARGVLVALVDHQDVGVATVAAKWVVRSTAPRDAVLAALIRGARREEDDVADASIEWLGALGEKAAQAVPTLVEVLADDTRSHDFAVVKTLGKIGPPAASSAPAILRAVAQHEEWEDAWEAENPGVTSCGIDIDFYADDALAAMGPAVVPVLVEALASESYDVKSSARRALTDIGAASVPALREATRSPNPDVRYVAVSTLGRLAKYDPTALDDVVRLMGDEVGLVAIGAVGSLSRFGDPAVPHVAAALRDPRLNTTAARAAVGLRDHADVLLADVVALLSDESASTRGQALETLTFWGPVAASAARPVIARLSDEDERVRRHALAALRAMGPSALADVEARLHSDVRTEQLAALDVIARSADASATAKASAQRLLSDRDVHVRLGAARILSLDASARDAAVPVLVELVAAPPNGAAEGVATRLVIECIRALHRYGPGDERTVGAVLSGMERAAAIDFPDGHPPYEVDDDWEAIGPLVGQLGVRHPALVVAALGTENDGVRWCVWAAVEMSGPPAAPALVERARLGREEGDDAVSILASIARDDAAARPHLETLMRSAPDLLVQIEALAAYVNITSDRTSTLGLAVDLLERTADDDVRLRVAQVLDWRFEADAAPEEKRIRAVYQRTQHSRARSYLGDVLETIETR